MLLNASIVLLSAAVFGDYQSVLLGGISLYVSGKLIDCVVAAPPRVQQVNVSNNAACEQTAMLYPTARVVDH